MDEDNSLNIRNWVYNEPTSVKGNLGLQLMSPTIPENPFLGARSNVIITSVNGASTHHMQMFQPPDSASDEMLDQVEEASVEMLYQFAHVLETPNNAIVGVVVGGNQHVVRHAYLCIPCL
ncbi:hypothetical protein OIU79_029923 [Salix purpurea]|uniref:Uncharacterized protein n=2 Tax=Salix TaxID=40685 RepID=A0A9Q1AB48_9ROSI|nr:hypothetical protein OIU79_029923 [Salix purpurea]KAJ6764923.1 hypothetical protein OIU74_023736 [Salix koriyanagi]